MSTLVIIHLGEAWPHYLKDCIKQARLINPGSEIIIIINNCHSFRILPLQTVYKLKIVFVEDLPQSERYNEFSSKIVNLVDLHFRKKYWQYVFERFFVLERYCEAYHSGSLYMIETDNMVYVPLEIVKTTESLFSQDMAAPFDNLEQGYPSFVFFRNKQAVSKFAIYMLEELRKEYLSDMKILGKYRKERPDAVFAYPLLPHSCNTPLRDRQSNIGHKAKAEETAFLSHPQFPIVFDAIAYGQALSGIDPRNTGGIPTVGYINESALYSIQETKFGWIQSSKLWFPIVNTNPLVNLHIHSKALSNFLSDNEEMPQSHYNAKELEKELVKDLNN